MKLLINSYGQIMCIEIVKVSKNELSEDIYVYQADGTCWRLSRDKDKQVDNEINANDIVRILFENDSVDLTKYGYHAVGQQIYNRR